MDKVDFRVEPVTAPLLAGTPHGFMTRAGGVSHPPVAGLQCGFGADDDAAAVAENRRRAAEAILPGAALVSVYQVHSADVVTVNTPWDDENRPKADALVTAQKGVLLGIITADCAPVLFADLEAGVIGAAHAGWRGAHGGILENTVEAMCALGASRENICAAIGPCIAQKSYEVDDGFRANFTEDDARFFVPAKAGHWLFSLESYVECRLKAAGVSQIAPLGLDTYPDEARFYSYRRATHRKEANYGRQLSLIGME